MKGACISTGLHFLFPTNAYIPSSNQLPPPVSGGTCMRKDIRPALAGLNYEHGPHGGPCLDPWFNKPLHRSAENIQLTWRLLSFFWNSAGYGQWDQNLMVVTSTHFPLLWHKGLEKMSIPQLGANYSTLLWCPPPFISFHYLFPWSGLNHCCNVMFLWGRPDKAESEVPVPTALQGDGYLQAGLQWGSFLGCYSQPACPSLSHSPQSSQPIFLVFWLNWMCSRWQTPAHTSTNYTAQINALSGENKGGRN